MGGGPTQIKGAHPDTELHDPLTLITMAEVAHPPHPVLRIKSIALTGREKKSLSTKPHPQGQASLHDLGPHSRASGPAMWEEQWNLPLQEALIRDLLSLGMVAHGSSQVTLESTTL